jgi:hypothetical protein
MRPGVWALTTISELSREEFSRRGSIGRTVGIFKLLFDATTVVIGNFGDIYEKGSYPLAVIEFIPFGLYAYHAYQDEPLRVWFRWIDNGYVRLDGPPPEEESFIRDVGRLVNYASIG